MPGKKSRLDEISGIKYAEVKAMERGMEKGLEKGKLEGLKEGAKETAKKLLMRGFSLEQVADITELTMEEVMKLDSRG